MGRIKMLTDSASDIPMALRGTWDIEVLPFPIEAGERELLDGVDLPPREFYRLLHTLGSVPTHAQLTEYVFESCFERTFQEGYTDLIYVSINAKASATWQNAVNARQSFYSEHPQACERFRITIIDSACYTMGYGWAVLRGAQMAREGAEAGEIADWIRDWLEHVRILFVPFDLKYARKSGRISAVAAFVGETMGLKPIMTFEGGESRVLEKARGEKNVIPALLRRCKQERAAGSPCLLIRADNPPQADLLERELTAALGHAPEMSYEIGGVISINAGPNLIGLIYRRA